MEKKFVHSEPKMAIALDLVHKTQIIISGNP